MKHIAILGSTGSIGKNALSVVETHADEFKVVGLAANRDVDTLEQQIRRYRPALVAVNEPTAAGILRARIRDINGTEILAGTEGLQAVATMPQAAQILDGMGGSAGLLPTLAAINAGKDIAFVNKEVMVMAGPLVNAAVKTNGVNLIPIDGEMSAIFQCLEGARDQQTDIHRLLITASGGALPRGTESRTLFCNARTGTPAPELEDGTENHYRFRNDDEQRVRGHRSKMVV